MKKRGVESTLQTDFLIMQMLARLLSRVPVLRDLRFDDSMRQFGVPLHQQLDFKLEAQNLSQFAANFRCARDSRACSGRVELNGSVNNISSNISSSDSESSGPDMQEHQWCALPAPAVAVCEPRSLDGNVHSRTHCPPLRQLRQPSQPQHCENWPQCLPANDACGTSSN